MVLVGSPDRVPAAVGDGTDGPTEASGCPMTTTPLPDGLAEYFAARQQQRDDRANTAWKLLRPYERRLVREAAVMGYVLGRRAGEVAARSASWRSTGQPEDTFPGDFDIVRSVLQHCDSTHELYPYLAEACHGQRRRVTRKRMWPGEAADNPITSEDVDR